MNATVPGDLPILYILIAIVILLALLAAIGAWVRGGGISRQDAESLFNDTQERHREEILKLEAALEKSRAEAAEALARTQAEIANNMRELSEQLVRSRTDLESAVTRSHSELESCVSRSAKDQQESLASEIQTVSRMLSDHDQRAGAGLNNLSTSVQSLNSQVKLAGDSMNRTLMEMARQQRDQKAQSTIQLCEALITSLGTLKSTIANQITHTADANTVNAEQVREPETLSAPEAAEWQSPFADESGAVSDEQEEGVTIDGTSSSFEDTTGTGIHIADTNSATTDESSHSYGDTEPTPTGENDHPYETADPATGVNTDSVDTNHDSTAGEPDTGSFQYDRDRGSF